MRRRRLARLLCLLPALAARPSRAEEGAPVILTVEGLAGHGARDFTLEALEALGMERLRTVTPWTRGPQDFSGVPLRRLLAALGVPEGAAMRAEALNRYTVSLGPRDAGAFGGLLATRLGGQPMRVRDRGPIWLVFPWSQRPELDRPEVQEHAIWQLRRLSLR